MPAAFNFYVILLIWFVPLLPVPLHIYIFDYRCRTTTAVTRRRDAASSQKRNVGNIQFRRTFCVRGSCHISLPQYAAPVCRCSFIGQFPGG